jgi:hypothetical protein
MGQFLQFWRIHRPQQSIKKQNGKKNKKMGRHEQHGLQELRQIDWGSCMSKFIDYNLFIILTFIN